MDYRVGQIVDCVDEARIVDNTIVVFSLTVLPFIEESLICERPAYPEMLAGTTGRSLRLHDFSRRFGRPDRYSSGLLRHFPRQFSLHPYLDAAVSVLIGILLAAVAVLLSSETGALLVGERTNRAKTRRIV